MSEVEILGRKGVPSPIFGGMRYTVAVGWLVACITVYNDAMRESAGVAANWDVHLWGSSDPIMGGSISCESEDPVREACEDASKVIRHLCREMMSVAEFSRRIDPPEQFYDLNWTLRG